MQPHDLSEAACRIGLFVGVSHRARRSMPCLQTAQAAFGYATMQDALSDIIDEWMVKHEQDIDRWEGAQDA